MTNRFREAADKHLLLAAHRGLCAGNIPCNSIPAFKAALYAGADILEIDITKSADNELFVFHPGKEKYHLFTDINLEQMNAEEIRKLRYYNPDGTKTQYPICTLDEFFEEFKGQCFVNIDKFWTCMQEITDCVRRHEMQDFIVIKSYPADECFDMIEEIAPDIPYMPMLTNEDEYTDMLLKRNIRLIGSEAHFTSEDCEVASEEYIESMHKKGFVVWANSIVFDYRVTESAGHTDDIAVTGNPEQGWGWLAKRGYDIIQTDWVQSMKAYLFP